MRGKAAFSDFYQNERFNLPHLHAEILNRMVVGNNTNHIKYLISSEPHRHLNPRRIDAEMVIPF
ncbi:steroid delta-isomerase domain-containing protein [Shewanella decolorationis S12]|uniref:Steroid delta-isomerase domain-containing protein n=1 Tax=Shewanella decolorationis S12 TaxID=1353536 RepID=A0ABP2Z038_9GAMM|nr:steroid delta-isomerase domain-containing protein [Shewanella decolorationis]ESE39965.1 steroid delta-isomerase domain-containing protein [Shewanella decolorationis S12]GLR34158.1 hypothetical protein GCM10007922_37170 [Shewanella decolorationis]